MRPHTDISTELPGASNWHSALFDRAPFGVVITDSSGGILAVNPALCRMLGFTPAAMAGRAFTDFVVDGDRQGWAAAAPDPARPETAEYTVRLHRNQAAAISCRVSSALVLDPARGPCRQDVVIDMSERDDLAMALELAEAQLRAVFAENPLPMWIYDVETLRFLDVNDAALIEYGYTRQEFVKLAMSAICLPHDVEKLRAELAQAPQFLPAERWRYRTKSGRVIEVETTSHTMSYGGRTAMLVLAQEVTERRRAEEALLARDVAEAANRAKSDYLSRMSHELRTPLTAILGFSELIEMDTARDAERERAAAIRKAGEHLLHLVNDVLDIARLESGAESMSVDPVKLDDVVGECRNLVAPQAAHRNITLRVLPVPPDTWVRADRQRVVQVLVNFAGNAVKYGPPEGTVEIAAEVIESERVRISVRDEGPGIEPALQARLFTPFDRLGAERTNVVGTGLGLALAKRLTEAMGGAVGVSSIPGQGATFWVELERTDAPESTKTRDATSEDQESEPVATGICLYVEDNPATTELMTEVFRRRPDVRVLTATQGLTAIDLAREHQPGLVVLDLHLPDITGEEVLHQLRINTRTRDIPVVILTADAMPQHRERLLAAGAAAFVTKPIRVHDFLGVIDQFL